MEQAPNLIELHIKSLSVYISSHCKSSWPVLASHTVYPLADMYLKLQSNIHLSLVDLAHYFVLPGSWPEACLISFRC